MATQQIIWYFRGTTLNWPGSAGSQAVPVTCTTLNPVKAVLFAMCCPGTGSPVIYLAKNTMLKDVDTSLRNVLDHIEEEVGLDILPVQFYPKTEGYLTLSDAVDILRQMNITPPAPVKLDNLTQVMEQVGAMPEADINIFIQIATLKLKNP